jgi:hypothetical protein
MTTEYIGEEGFRWFVGVIEDREDPLKQGRVRARAYSIHGDKVEIPTDSLPWATVLMPGYSSSLKQVGTSPTGLQLGSTVIGFFLDGNESQMPIIFGIMPGDQDISNLAIGRNTINKQQVGPEPESAYKTKYPYNKVFQSESGHIIEIDDTPNFERTHTYHKSGTYTEVNNEGRRVNKIVGDDFEIVLKNKTLYVQGNLNIEVKGTTTITSPTVTINGNVRVNGSITSSGDVVGGGISLDGHTHSDPQGGLVGKPQ